MAHRTVYAITDLAPRQADPTSYRLDPAGTRRSRHALRWVRDVTFAKDLSQVRTSAAPQVIASLRDLIISLRRLAGATNIAAALRHHARDALRPAPPTQII